MEKVVRKEKEVPAELIGCGSEQEDSPTKLYADYC